MENLTSEQKKAKYNLAIDILTKAVEKFNEEMKELNFTEVKVVKDVEFDLNEFWQTIQNLTNQALEWERDLLKTFVLLKRIETWVKSKCDNLKWPAYSQYIDRQLNARDEIAFWYWFSVTTRKTINFDEDEEYAKINKTLKEREDILKNAVNQSEKNNTVVDENGEVIQPPSYTYSSSLTIKKV